MGVSEGGSGKLGRSESDLGALDRLQHLPFSTSRYRGKQKLGIVSRPLDRLPMDRRASIEPHQSGPVALEASASASGCTSDYALKLLNPFQPVVAAFNPSLLICFGA